MGVEQLAVEVREELAAPPAGVFTLRFDVKWMGGLGLKHVRFSWEGERRRVGAGLS